MKNCCLKGKCQHSQLPDLTETNDISEETSPVFMFYEKNLDLEMVCTQSLEKELALCLPPGNGRR